MGLHQDPLAPAQRQGAVHVEIRGGDLDLEADEFGLVLVAVLVEPVGVNEARGVVVGCLEDGAEEASVGYGQGSWSGEENVYQERGGDAVKGSVGSRLGPFGHAEKGSGVGHVRAEVQ
jgi:hypothetical protein